MAFWLVLPDICASMAFYEPCIYIQVLLQPGMFYCSVVDLSQFERLYGGLSCFIEISTLSAFDKIH